jgi:RHS repeat-associated protein
MTPSTVHQQVARTKNIIGYIDSSDGTSVADYEYSPFGKLIVKSGTKADDFNFKFSSYFTDDETGLVYYGYRYYDADMGRWLNRDPIGERGGNNLYGFVGNDGINGWDRLGMWPDKPERDGKRWAKICSNDKKDTHKNLAKLIRLEAAQAFGADGWLKNDDGSDATKVEYGKTYKVPNTFAVYTSKATGMDSYNPGSWAFGMANKLRSRAEQLGDIHKERGFKVIRKSFAASYNGFANLWTEEGISGIAFAGHGAVLGSPIFGLFDTGKHVGYELGNGMFIAPNSVHPKYRLELVAALYCRSAKRAEEYDFDEDDNVIFPGGSAGMWIQHVSTNKGKFMGFSNNVNTLDWFWYTIIRY